MNEALFWDLVAVSQGSADTLKQVLSAYSREEIIAFDHLLDEALYQLDQEAIHTITDGSDDGFEYIRLWIASQGRDYYEAVLRDPQQAPLDADEDQENPDFGTAARRAYEETWQEEYPGYLSKRASGTNIARWP
jgi:hypothetical protein